MISCSLGLFFFLFWWQVSTWHFSCSWNLVKLRLHFFSLVLSPLHTVTLPTSVSRTWVQNWWAGIIPWNSRTIISTWYSKSKVKREKVKFPCQGYFFSFFCNLISYRVRCKIYFLSLKITTTSKEHSNKCKKNSVLARDHKQLSYIPITVLGLLPSSCIT